MLDSIMDSADNEGLASSQHNAETQKTATKPVRSKTIACVICRGRKLRCDGARPACHTCARLGHNCSYDNVRKKSGPKKGHGKSLESRLAQLETLLMTQLPVSPLKGSIDSPNGTTTTPAAISHLSSPDFELLSKMRQSFQPTNNAFSKSKTSNEVMWLDLDEPMPPQDTIDELDRLYFEKVHPTFPLIHPNRYFAALRLAPKSQPPPCLRYAMWTWVAATQQSRYPTMDEHFYRRSRKYLERDEMRDRGTDMFSVQHVQTWFLISMFEFKSTQWPRAWMSSGRACRLAIAIGLNRLDIDGLNDVKQCIPPPKDWTEREERRRTFWMAFSGDRLASIGTGWAMSIDEADISTNLPVNDSAFENSRDTQSMALSEALSSGEHSEMSSLTGMVLSSYMCGKILHHLHRVHPNDHEEDLNGTFWSRHREIDNTLSNISLNLPSHLRLPAGIDEPNTLFLNICLHTITTCLHQTAIFKADTNKLPQSVSVQSMIRCITSGAEIASIMKMAIQTDMSTMHPFAPLGLHIASRVFIRYLKTRPNDNNILSSLQFLITALQSLKKSSLFSESLLTQLDVDLQSAGLGHVRSLKNRINKNRMNKDSELNGMQRPDDPLHLAGDSKTRRFGSQCMYIVNSKTNQSTDLDKHNTDKSRSSFTSSSNSGDQSIQNNRKPSVTYDDEFEMDIINGNDIQHVHSTDSCNNVSSRNTMTSPSTPSLHHADSHSPLWIAGDDLNIFNTAAPTTGTISDNEFQMIMEQHTDLVYRASHTDEENPLDFYQTHGIDPSNLTIPIDNSVNLSYTLPNLDISHAELQYAGNGDDIFGNKDIQDLNDDDWKRLLDAEALNMGWGNS